MQKTNIEKARLIGKISKKAIYYYIFLILIPFSCVLFTIPLSIIITILMSVMCYNSYARKDGEILAKYLLVIILLSVLQSIYLGLFISRLEQTELQVMLSIHILYSFLTLIVWIIVSKKGIPWSVQLLFFEIAISCIGFIIYNPQIIAFLSSLRNLISPLMIFSLAYVLGRRINNKTLIKGIEAILYIVIIFGFIEFFAGNKLWLNLNITELCIKKNLITSTYSKIPLNWYSSEKIGGHQLRRMVSTFADPVNLGTFLFAGYVVAKHEKKSILKFMTLLCIVLCVSKGAFLGVLISMVINCWYRDRSKISVFVIASIAFGIGYAFIIFSRTSSTGSIFYHAFNFIKSFGILVTKPLGYGVGNAGVLARVTGGTISIGIVETGFGAIVSQLGIVGLVIYIYFFGKLLVGGKQISKNYVEDKVMFYSLLLSYIANVLFNEVALSPNSCGIYFVLLGTMLGQQNREIAEYW